MLYSEAKITGVDLAHDTVRPCTRRSPGAQRDLLEEAAAETFRGARGACPARALLTIFLPVKKAGAAFRAVKVAAISGNLLAPSCVLPEK